jgi:hypothetical protein
MYSYTFFSKKGGCKFSLLKDRNSRNMITVQAFDFEKNENHKYITMKFTPEEVSDISDRINSNLITGQWNDITIIHKYKDVNKEETTSVFSITQFSFQNKIGYSVNLSKDKISLNTAVSLVALRYLTKLLDFFAIQFTFIEDKFGTNDYENPIQVQNEPPVNQYPPRQNGYNPYTKNNYRNEIHLK